MESGPLEDQQEPLIAEPSVQSFLFQLCEFDRILWLYYLEWKKNFGSI